MLKPSVQIHNVDGILVAEFWDCLRLDPAPVQDLRSTMKLMFSSGGGPSWSIDLSGVGFAGSAALGNFVALHRLVRQNGGRIIFSRRGSDGRRSVPGEQTGVLVRIRPRSGRGPPRDQRAPRGHQGEVASRPRKIPPGPRIRPSAG